MEQIHENTAIFVHPQIFDFLSIRWSSSGVSIVT